MGNRLPARPGLSWSRPRERRAGRGVGDTRSLCLTPASLQTPPNLPKSPESLGRALELPAPGVPGVCPPPAGGHCLTAGSAPSQISAVRLPREPTNPERLKGFGYAEFEDIDSLFQALSLNEEVSAAPPGTPRQRRVPS